MRALHLTSLVFAAVHLLTAASPAFAQSAAPSSASAPGGDVIQLKNGGILRGTLVDVIPGSHARIQLATGEVTTVPWDQVARVESARNNPAAPSAPTAPSAPPARVAPTLRKIVHINAPRQVRLERRAPGTKVWSEVCSSPCDHDVDATGTFRISGSGVRSSKPFAIESMSDENVYIDVDPSSSGWFVGGIVLTSVGGITMFIGLIMAVIGSAASELGGRDESLTHAGLGVAGVGLLGAVTGIVALTSNIHSSASVSPLPPSNTNAESASTRRPTWLDATSTSTSHVPAPITTTIFSTTF